MTKQAVFCRVLFVGAIFALGVIAYDNNYTYCVAPLDSTPSVPPSPSHSLSLLQVIIRHGDRTPQNGLGDPFYEPSPIWTCGLNTLNKPSISTSQEEQVNRLFRVVYEEGKEVLKGNCMYGQLTDVGYAQHIALGQNLRNLYGSSGLLDINFLKVRSTNVYRTLQSGMTFLTGLFPESNNKLTEIIKVTTRDEQKENMTPGVHSCPTWQNELNKYYKAPAWVNYHKNVSYVRFMLNLKTKFNITQIPDLYNFFDEYSARTCHGFALPPPITSDDLKRIAEIATWEWNYSLYPRILGKLGSGRFISDLLDNLLQFQSGASKTKMYLYSGHDSTIAPLLAALGLYDGLWPPYASHVQFELWTNSGADIKLGVRYNGKAIFLRRCNSYFCSLDEVKKWWGSMIPTKSECYGV